MPANPCRDSVVNMLPAWERYRPLLRVYIRRTQLDRRVRHGCDTSDLIQETYVRALKGLDGCQARTEGEFIAWLGKIAKHVVIDQGRAARAIKRDPARLVSVQASLTQSSVDLQKLIAANCPSPSAHLRTDELRLRLAEAIDQLPEDQRDVIILRDLCEESVDDIATQLSKTDRAVAGLLLRGRRRLRELLSDLR